MRVQSLLTYFLFLYYSYGKATLLADFANIFFEEHLTRCILNISVSYFNTDLPTAVQTPGMWFPSHQWKNTFGDVFLKLLNNYSYIPQVLWGYNSNVLSKTENVVKPGSYILLVPQMTSVLDVIIIKKMFLIFQKNAFNPTGKFIIVTDRIVPSLKRKSFLSIIFQFALEVGFTEVIVLLPWSNSRKLSVNSLKGFKVFGWLLQEQNNISSLIIDKIQYLDTWSLNEIAFHFNVNLFPLKDISTNKHCLINMAFESMFPFIYFSSGKLQGSFAKIMEAFIKQCKCEMVFNLKSPPHIRFPFIYDTNVLYEHDLTYPHYRHDITWYVPSGSKIPPWKSLIRAFTPQMWLLVTFTSACGASCLWMLKKTSKHMTNTDCSMNNILITVILTHLGYGVSDIYKGPASVSFFALWLFYCLIINAAYQSELFGFMVNPGENPPIKTETELKDSKLRLKTTFIGRQYKKFEACKGYRCTDEVAYKHKQAVLLDTMSGAIHMKLYRDLQGNPGIVPLADIVDTTYYGAQVNKLPGILYNKLDTMLHRAVSASLIHHTNQYHMWALYHQLYKEVKDNHRLSLWHVQGAFYILVILLIMSSFIFLFEILFYNLC